LKTLILKFLLIVVFASYFFNACVPSKETYEEKVLPVDRLIKKLEANRRKIKTFEGTGVFNVDGPKLTAKASFEVKLKKPDSLQFSIYGPFGIDLAQVLITNSDYMFYDVLKNKVYRGAVRDEIVKKLFRINLSFQELVDAFTGAVNLTDKLRKNPDHYELGDDSYFLTYVDSVNMKKSLYKILIKNLAISEFRLYRLPDDLLFEGKYSDFKRYTRNVPIPRKTEIINNPKNQEIIIEYRRIKVNNEIYSMKLDLPEDAKVIEW